ncbi:MAG: inorganic phosphate transporter [Polyangiaceae bacterium]
MAAEGEGGGVTLTWLLILTVVGVFVFDFTNGFHDTANLIATAVASRAMRPIPAVVIAAVFTLLGPLIAGTAVADTVGQIVTLDGMPAIAAVTVVLAALAGAITWNIGTWLFGIPSSSSHALVGALCGTTLVTRGASGIHWGLGSEGLTGVARVTITLLVSPVLGMIAGFLAQRLARLALRRATPRINGPIKHLQVVGTALMAFSHGANDAQKSMGVLTLVLLLSGHLDRFVVPTWVVFLCAAAITSGTVLGGWRIVKTLGFGIYRLRPIHALNVQLASGGVILGAAFFGGPVSTTHVVSSAVMGVGAAERPRGVRWQKARDIAWTWLVTIPGAGIAAIVWWWIASHLFSL